MRASPDLFRFLTIIICLFISATPAAFAQDEEDPVFRQEELDQMLAPIALYPDSLLTQILMASTFPLDVVQADRWARQNKGLEGDEMTSALEEKNWDPSVKSLVNFPQILAMMSERLEWAQQLGEAFTTQQQDVLETVQRLRAKAREAGNLSSTDEQVVKVEDNSIIIEPARPEVIFVPAYNPAVIYGRWWYPDYPPFYYYPPGYVAGSYISFTSGITVGAAWGYAWGYPNWRGRDVIINVNRNVFINRGIDRGRYFDRYPDGRGQWKWRAAMSPQAESRQAYRGYAGNPFMPGSQARQMRQDRPPQELQPMRQRPQPAQPPRAMEPPRQRPPGGGQSPGVFSGMERGGSATRDMSSRGASSRQNAPAGGRGVGPGGWR